MSRNDGLARTCRLRAHAEHFFGIKQDGMHFSGTQSTGMFDVEACLSYAVWEMKDREIEHEEDQVGIIVYNIIENTAWNPEGSWSGWVIQEDGWSGGHGISMLMGDVDADEHVEYGNREVSDG